LKSESLSLLEPYGPVQGCNGIALSVSGRLCFDELKIVIYILKRNVTEKWGLITNTIKHFFKKIQQNMYPSDILVNLCF
jgi:hypothetical protein